MSTQTPTPSPYNDFIFGLFQDKNTYKQVSQIKLKVQEKDKQTYLDACNTILYALTDPSVAPMSKLLAAKVIINKKTYYQQLGQDLIDLKNPEFIEDFQYSTFNCYQDIGLYKHELKEDDRGKFYFSDKPDKLQQTIGVSFLKLILESIISWAKMYPIHPQTKQPSKFATVYFDLAENYQVLFPKPVYFKESSVVVDPAFSTIMKELKQKQIEKFTKEQQQPHQENDKLSGLKKILGEYDNLFLDIDSICKDQYVATPNLIEKLDIIVQISVSLQQQLDHIIMEIIETDEDLSMELLAKQENLVKLQEDFEGIKQNESINYEKFYQSYVLAGLPEDYQDRRAEALRKQKQDSNISNKFQEQKEQNYEIVDPQHQELKQQDIHDENKEQNKETHHQDLKQETNHENQEQKQDTHLEHQQKNQETHHEPQFQQQQHNQLSEQVEEPQIQNQNQNQEEINKFHHIEEQKHSNNFQQDHYLKQEEEPRPFEDHSIIYKISDEKAEESFCRIKVPIIPKSDPQFLKSGRQTSQKSIKQFEVQTEQQQFVQRRLSSHISQKNIEQVSIKNQQQSQKSIQQELQIPLKQDHEQVKLSAIAQRATVTSNLEARQSRRESFTENPQELYQTPQQFQQKSELKSNQSSRPIRPLLSKIKGTPNAALGDEVALSESQILSENPQQVILDLQRRIRQSIEENEKIIYDLKKSQQENKQISMEVRNLNLKIQEQKQLINELQRDKQEVQNYYQDLETNLMHQNQLQQNTIQQLERKIETLNQNKLQESNQFDASDKQQELLQQLRNAHNMINILNEKINYQNQDFASQNEKLRNLEDQSTHEINQLRQANNKLQRENRIETQQLQEEIEFLTSNLQEQKRYLEEYKKKYDNLVKESESLRTRNDEQRVLALKEQQNFNKQNMRQEKEIKDLNELLENQNERIAELESEKLEAQKQIEDLFKKQIQQNEIKAKLMGSNRQQKQDFTDIQPLHDKILKLEEDLHNQHILQLEERKQLEIQHQQKMSNSLYENADLKSQLKEALANIKDLNSKLSLQIKDKSNLEEKCFTLENQQAYELEQYKASLVNQLKEHRFEQQKLNDEIDLLKQESFQNRKIYEDTKKKNDYLNKECEILRLRNEDQQSQLIKAAQQSSKELLKKDQEIKDLSSKILDQKRKIKEKENDKKEIEKQVDELQFKLLQQDSLQTKLLEQARLQKLESQENQALMNQIRKLQDEIHVQKMDSLEQFERQQNQNLSILNAGQHENLQLLSQVKQLEEHNRELSDQLEYQNQNVNRLQQKCSFFEGQQSYELSQIKQQQNKVQREHSGEVQKLQDEIDFLRQGFEEVKNSNEDLRKKNENIVRESEIQRQKSDQQRAQIFKELQQANKDKIKQEKEISDLNQLIISKDDRIQELENDKQEIQQTIESLQQKQIQQNESLQKMMEKTRQQKQQKQDAQPIINQTKQLEEDIHNERMSWLAEKEKLEAQHHGLLTASQNENAELKSQIKEAHQIIRDLSDKIDVQGQNLAHMEDKCITLENNLKLREENNSKYAKMYIPQIALQTSALNNNNKFLTPGNNIPQQSSRKNIALDQDDQRPPIPTYKNLPQMYNIPPEDQVFSKPTINQDEVMHVIYPYQTAELYYKEQIKNLRLKNKGKLVKPRSTNQIPGEGRQLSDSNLRLLRYRSFGSNGLIYSNNGFQVGIQIILQKQNKQIFISMGVYYRNSSRAPIEDLKITYENQNAFKQFWMNPKQLSQTVNSQGQVFQEIFLDHKDATQPFVNVSVVAGQTQHQFQLPNNICLFLKFTTFRLKDFNSKWKAQIQTRIKSEEKKFDYQTYAFIRQQFPMFQILNENKAHDFQLGIGEMKLGIQGVYQENLQFVMKIIFYSNNEFICQLSYDQNLSSFRSIFEDILNGIVSLIQSK